MQLNVTIDSYCADRSNGSPSHFKNFHLVTQLQEHDYNICYKDYPTLFHKD